MNLLSKFRTALAVATTVFVSAQPAHAEDIEIYLYQNEGSGANILLLVDNSGGTNRTFSGTSYSGFSPAKTTDEITYALKQVIDATSGNSRIGIAAQLAGGTNGGAIQYPVKTMNETVDPVAYASVKNNDDEAIQEFDLGGAVLPTPVSTGTWGTIDTTTTELPLPAQLATNATRSVMAITLTGLDIPRYAKVNEAVLTFTSPSTPTGATSSFEAMVAHEQVSTPSPLAGSDLSSFSWSEDFDTNYNSKGTLDGGVLTLYITDAIQNAVSSTTWCGGQDLTLLVMATDIQPSQVPEVYTQRSVDMITSEVLGNTQLNVAWDATNSSGQPTPTTIKDNMACMQNITVNVPDFDDDATEAKGAANSANILLNESELLLEYVSSGPSSTRGEYVGAANFGSLSFGAGTIVESADLTGNISSVSGTTPAFSVKAITEDTPSFADVGDIKGKSVGSIVASVSAATGDFSVDITAILNDLFANNWAQWQSLGLQFERTAGTSIGLTSRDSGAAGTLSITMGKVYTQSPGEFGEGFSRKAEMKVAVEQASANATGKNKLVGSYIEAGAYMLGNDPAYPANTGLSHEDAFEDASRSNFLSPAEAYTSCGGNHIIMVTHAESAGESYQTEANDLMDAALPPAGATAEEIAASAACTDDGNDYAWTCIEKLSRFLNKNDITTHAIAFEPQQDETYVGLKAAADASEGEYQETADAQQLALKLIDLINSLTTTDASMAAPGVAVNQLNRFTHLNQLFYALFRPDEKSRWQGNLKRYGIDFASQSIIDQDGNVAVGSDGFFLDSANSWWSATVDGGLVSEGGALEQLQTSATPRKLLVSQTSPAPSGNIDDITAITGANMTEITAPADISDAEAELGMSTADAADSTKVQQRIDMLLSKWGDPLHSEPRLINFGYQGNDYAAAEADPDLQNNLVFTATNDGAMHVIDPVDGSERFTWMPAEEMARTESRFYPAALNYADPQRSTYGLDGGITVWRRPKSDGSGDPEHVFLYVGQRRGGEAYYALDVTTAFDTTPAPKLLWKIDSSQAAFTNLGQSWSAPTLTQVMIDGVKVPVLVFGGGYSPTDHDSAGNISTGDAKGNSIYMVNAFNGKLIWSASDSGATTNNSDMKWAIPSSISAVDYDYDGLLDYLYASDLGGQVFRIDIDNSNDGVTGGTTDLVKRVTTVAKLGTSDASASGISDHRRFFSEPVVSLGERNGSEVLQIIIGSGYRAHPLDEQTDDSIYAIDDTSVLNDTAATTVTRANLLDVTTNLSPSASDFSGKAGWYIDLTNSGEKVLSAAVISSGVIYITSYLPDSVYTSECSRVVGSSRLYAVNVLDGSPALDFNGDGKLDRSRDIALPGLPPSPQILLDGSDEQIIIVGTDASKGGEISTGPGVRKTRWFQVDTETAAEAQLAP